MSVSDESDQHGSAADGSSSEDRTASNHSDGDLIEVNSFLDWKRTKDTLLLWFIAYFTTAGLLFTNGAYALGLALYISIFVAVIYYLWRTV